MAFKMKPKFGALANSPRYAVQEKKDLGKYNVIDDIAGSSPAKKVDKMGQRIIKQGEKAEAAKAEGNDKKATRHTNRAKRMNERDTKKKTKQNLKEGRKVGKTTFNPNSPAKQKDTKVSDIPQVLEETGKKVLEKGKKIIKDIGNITLSSKERKACKKKGGRFKKGVCYMPQAKKNN
tara:strand:- start:1685 stop:2215 length:531 start_codon:yes stop_codon:yes gene_type:complete